MSVFTLLCASVAFASRPHEFKEVFSSPGSGPGQLSQPDGVAVSEGTGDVYVVDTGNKRIEYFSSKGAFIGEFAGTSATGSGTLTSGSTTIESALASTGAFNVGQEISAPGLKAKTTITAIKAGGVLEVSQAATASELASLSAHEGFEAPEAIAVDNSCALEKLSEPECKAKDPSNGDVYVTDEGIAEKGHRVIDKYSPTGTYLGQITEGPGGRLNRALDGLSVSHGGTLLLYQETREVSRYSNAEANVFISPATEIPALPCCGHPGFATDANGNFYVSHGGVPSLSKIAKVSPTGSVLNPELQDENASAVAIDQSNEHAFIDDLTSVAVLETFEAEPSRVELLERLGQEHGEKHLQQGAGVAVNAGEGSAEGAGDVYVADAAGGEVAMFILSEPTTPKLEGESISEVSAETALLGAQINPRSEVGEAATEYTFEYGRCSGECKTSGYEHSAPQPDGQIAADFNGHAVSVEVTGLQASTSYHFRVIAKNAHGVGEEGKEQTFTTQSAGGPLALPDNRGWELVSPPDKRGALIEPISQSGIVQAAADGSAITYLANAPTEAQPAGYANEVQILSRRSAAAWSSRDVALPHVSTTGFSISAGPEYKSFDQGLEASAVQPFGEFNPGLSEEASEPTAYLHELSESCASHCYHPLVTGKAPFANVPEGVHFGEAEKCEAKAEAPTKEFCGPEFLGASEDLSHAVLRSGVGLGGGAEPGLYEWGAGALSPVSVIPKGNAGESVNSALGSEDLATRGAISADGSLVDWSTPTPQALYARERTRGETAQLDEAKAPAGEGASEKKEREERSGEGRFQIASVDGSRVFFSDSKRLSEDSHASSTKADLYECKVAVRAGKLGCELSDLTPGAEGAGVQGGVLGASEDGSYLYFVATGALSEDENAREEKAAAGKPNLYLLHEGQLRFIATLSGGDEHDWSDNPAFQPTRVSPSGRFLSLMSQASLTGYDNRDRATGAPTAEVYLYDAATNRLACASCEPTGARPAGVEYLKLEAGTGGLVGGFDTWPRNALVAANVPGWTRMTASPHRPAHQPRYLTNQGRLFFNTADALVGQDANGTQDVYEYEPPGVGSCSEADLSFSPGSGGCVALVSSGRSAQGSAFLDASEPGDDVFFLSSAVLSPLDSDSAFDVYDAHVCTDALPCISFPSVQSPPCTTEASCKASPTPQPAIFGAPASATFQGPGNLSPKPPSAPPPPTPEQLRVKKLEKALKSCRVKKVKKKRQACEKTARKRYAKPKSSKSKRKATK